MKSRINLFRAVALSIVAVLSLQIGCSSSNAPNNAATQPSASPSPAADAVAGLAPAGAPGSQSAPASPNSAGQLVDGGAANSAAGAGATTPAATPAPPRTFTLAAGTPISIYTANTLSTKAAQGGERFTASLARPIVDGDWVIAKKGAAVEGVVVNADPGGRVKGRASISVALRSLELADGRTINLSTGSYTKAAKGTKKKDAAKIGIGAGIGAAIGAIAGGGKGAAIGAGAGGAAGTGMVLATRGDPAVIPSESLLTFKLTEPVKVTKQ